MSSHIRARESSPFEQSKPAGRRQGLASAQPAAVGVVFGGLVDVQENAPDRLGVGAAPAVEAHAAMAPVEQRSPEVVLEHADAVGDGGGGDAEFLGGTHEALVPGGGLEVAQAVQWRERFHGIGGKGSYGWFA